MKRLEKFVRAVEAALLARGRLRRGRWRTNTQSRRRSAAAACSTTLRLAMPRAPGAVSRSGRTSSRRCLIRSACPVASACSKSARCPAPSRHLTMSDSEKVCKPERPSIRPIDWYAQHPPRAAHAVQVAIHHPGRDSVARPRHWREFGDFLVVRPDAAAAAAGAESRGAGQLQVAWTEAGIEVVQPGRRLRRSVQLPDVPGSRGRANQLHGHCGPSQLRRQRRLPGHLAQRRRLARLGQLLPGARTESGARPAVHARGRQDDRQPFRRRAQLRLLAHALRAESGRAQRNARHQRPGDDRGRRGAARLQRHHARQ